MNVKILCALSFAVIASPVAAQDFTGPRIEGRIGADAIGTTTRDTRDFNGRGDFGGSNHSTDFLFGAEVGFDIEVGKLVVGGYAGADITDVEQREQQVTFRTGRNLTAGGRAGIVLGKALVYAKGGYSYSRIVTDFEPGANQAPFARLKRNRNGIHVGGGAEFAVTEATYLRADYAHTFYKRFAIGPNNDFRFSRNQFTAAFGLRF